VEVLVDGGVRCGADVVKALALGARAVLVGRPVAWALAADGEQGVAELFEVLREEVEQALATIGCAGADAVPRAAVAPVGS
jgi:isopentenyl diphosphate isomerase/L-lactate dehydrogenase-like FMN-dependent dehydrogenase